MAPRFQFADSVRFSCSRCGDCCRTWNVMLGPGERERLRALEWKGRCDELAGLNPAVKVELPSGGSRQRLKRRPDGACVFLGEGDQCRLHEHFGASAKPLMCRLYPFGFYPLGDRVGVDVSFACRAVSEGLGEPLAGRTPEWAKLLEESGGAGGGVAGGDSGRHALRPGVALSGELVWELEHHLLQMLAESQLDLFDRLRCVVQFVRIATTGDPAAPTAAKLRQAMARGLPVQIAKQPSKAKMDRTQRAVFYQWLFLHLNPPPFDLAGWPANDQRSERDRRLKIATRFYQRKGAPWVDNRELPVSFKEVSKVAVRLTGEVAAVFETYLRAKILGQRFLVAGERELPFVEAVQLFLLSVPMAIWTAQALAAERGADAVEPVDVRRALRLVDRAFGTLSAAVLPRREAAAFHHVLLETDLVEAALRDLVRS